MCSMPCCSVKRGAPGGGRTRSEAALRLFLCAAGRSAAGWCRLGWTPGGVDATCGSAPGRAWARSPARRGGSATDTMPCFPWISPRYLKRSPEREGGGGIDPTKVRFPMVAAVEMCTFLCRTLLCQQRLAHGPGTLPLRAGLRLKEVVIRCWAGASISTTRWHLPSRASSAWVSWYRTCRRWCVSLPRARRSGFRRGSCSSVPHRARARSSTCSRSSGASCAAALAWCV